MDKRQTSMQDKIRFIFVGKCENHDTGYSTHFLVIFNCPATDSEGNKLLILMPMWKLLSPAYATSRIAVLSALLYFDQWKNAWKNSRNFLYTPCPCVRVSMSR
jgi:hypothetical protein